MDDMEDIQLKTELDEISQRIDKTLKNIETLFKQGSEFSSENKDGSV